MVFLIDDKRTRQQDFNWPKERFKKHKDQITPIYSLEDLEFQNNDIYKTNNSVIFHESFLDNNSQKNEVEIILNKIKQFAKNNSNFELAIFSGSKNSRSIDKNIAYLPVSVVYQNLAIATKNSKGKNFLNHLLFGENPAIEKTLNDKLDKALKNIDTKPAKTSCNKTLFFRPHNKRIDKPFDSFDIAQLFTDVSDQKLTQIINDFLNKEEYDNIFVPLCFGQVLSDFNGLRLATHIRCTSSLNQKKNILIYGFVGLDFLLQNKYFDILKTKNVELIGYNKKQFENIANSKSTSLTTQQLTSEIQKLKLDRPKNYDQNHDIKNEWSIFQWSRALEINEEPDIKKIFSKVNSDLYFKFLKAKEEIQYSAHISQKDLSIQKIGEPKILLIDDECEKGWNEVFAKLFGDINNIYFDYIGSDFRKLDQQSIIDISLKKINEEDYDVVILDFRLNETDFQTGNLSDITCIQVLSRIKELNPAIQVVVFSATNKVWNLKELNKAGADDFIFKNYKNDISQNIEIFIKTIQKGIHKSHWLKPIWKQTKSLIETLNFKKKNHVLDKDFVGAIKTYLELGFQALNAENRNHSFDSAFMYYFLILEASSKQFIDEDNPINFNSDYKFQFRVGSAYLKHYNEKQSLRTNNDLITKRRRIPYNQKFLNLIDYAGVTNLDPFQLVSLRNKFNHPDLVLNRRITIITKDDVSKIFEVCNKLISGL